MATRRKRLVSCDEAVDVKKQHKKPCGDCPWARAALNGWLGGLTADEWLAEVRGDGVIDCHTRRGAQCAGAAVFRSNICKLPLDPAIRLPADRETVFASPAQFAEHHSRLPTAEDE